MRIKGVEDLRTVAQAEALREFSFRPDTMCRNSREFTDALCQYARESGKDLVITKEGMYPEFTMDGIEYTAYRYFSRWGAVVQCTMKYPEQAGDGKISGKRKLIMRFLIRSLVPVLVFLVIALPRVEKTSQLIALLPLGAAYLILLKFSYGNFREKGH